MSAYDIVMSVLAVIVLGGAFAGLFGFIPTGRWHRNENEHDGSGAGERPRRTHDDFDGGSSGSGDGGGE